MEILEDTLLTARNEVSSFGLFLVTLRRSVPVKVTQADVIAHLPGWTVSTYSRLESGHTAPRFAQLPVLYAALQHCGVRFTPPLRQVFLALARQRIARQQTYKDTHTETEWAQLYLELARMEPTIHSTSTTACSPQQSFHAETRHLIGRTTWLAELSQMIQATPPKKLLILQGPMGIGKSSELYRLANLFLHNISPQRRIIWFALPALPSQNSPESTLDMLLSRLLDECGLGLFSPDISFLQRQTALLAYLEQRSDPMLILLDNAECFLSEQGTLASCWETFLTQFIRRHHQAILVCATKEWHGWPGRDSLLVAETFVPPLTEEESISLLQRLGLETIAVKYLQAISQRVGGIPLGLEWVARLIVDPLALDQWHDDNESMVFPSLNQPDLTRNVRLVLETPSLLSEQLINKLAPLLQHLMDHVLSSEAWLVLERLSLAVIPLGKPAYLMLCPRPGLLKELRDASLIAASTNRVQLLPLVASAAQQHLSVTRRHEVEELLIQAYRRWLDEGNMSEQEAGSIVTEIVVLLLNQHRLLEAADMLFRYGWLSFKAGNAFRLALLTEEVKKHFDWQTTLASWCGGTLLRYMLTPFLGKAIDVRERAEDYRKIRDASFTGQIQTGTSIKIGTTHYIMFYALNELRFTDAQQELDLCSSHFVHTREKDLEVHTALLEKQGMLLSRWGEYVEEQGQQEAARSLQEQAIAVYQQSVLALEASQESSSLQGSILKKRLAYALNYLGYHLFRIEHYTEALQALEKSRVLLEQGYGSFDSLPPCYGDLSQTLAAMGRFQEALQFDGKAYTEAERLASLGHTALLPERWVYRVNRGCLYLRLGRIEEAEQLLRESLPHISEQRRMYRMFAKKALEEIEQWRHAAISPQHQLDWRWVERYRALVSYDTYWWLAPAAPFTDEEQQEWEQVFTPHPDEPTKEQLRSILARATRREVFAALEEQREPRFRYPIADLAEVQRRIADLLQLETEIAHHEPNAIVRRLYHDAIEESVNTLRIIEATAEGNSDRFQASMQQVIPAPDAEEMACSLAFIKSELSAGFQRPETRQAGEQLIQILQERCQLSFDLLPTPEEIPQLASPALSASSQSRPPRLISAQTTQRFFEAIFQQSGMQEWRVVIDPGAAEARVEQGLRCLYLPHHALALQDVKHLLVHELAGHVARCLAGERSLVGLLGIHTKNSLTIEEGLVLYQEIEEERQRGNHEANKRLWSGTLATGLASGTITPPQTFFALFTIFEALFFFRRLLKNVDPDEETARKRARQFALARCLRTFRGVPDLTRPGVCFTQDAVYLRGFVAVERVAKERPEDLERLAVGVVALDQLADLQELGITHASPPFRQLAQDPQFDDYLLSFE